jgi:MoaA/NifB/PqqE/SkfB family radical SAM enzyme
MSAFVSISPSPDSTQAGTPDLEVHRVRAVPVIVIFPHSQCDCCCVMCDIWRIRNAVELSVADLERQVTSFRKLGVRWVVFSGGEPQKNTHLATLANMLRDEGVRITLLTAGLMLEMQAEAIADIMDDVILSLDGPPAVHDRIRRVPDAFARLADGVRALRRVRPEIPISARCTVQKMNHLFLCATTQSAREMGLNSISFLAADVTSEAFNRPSSWPAERQKKVALNVAEVEALDREIHRLIQEHTDDLVSGFIAESPNKLRRIVSHFRAHLGQAQPVAPRCNAPWTSAVIEAGGDVRPCFFQPRLGNLRGSTLLEILNGPQALQFRRNLDIARDPTCRRCVCSLYVPNPDNFDANVSAKTVQTTGTREKGNG